MPENKKPEPISSQTPADPSTAPVLPEHLAATLQDDQPETASPASENPAEPDDASNPLNEAAAAKVPLDSEHTAPPTGFRARLKYLFKAWWQNRKLRWATLAGLAIALLAVGFIPTSRYFILNHVGTRSSSSVKVLDSTTQQPLKNVQVQVANQTVSTDATGVAKLTKLQLGKTHLVISRRAFATVSQNVTLGWGSNPLGNFSLKPTGSRYSFTVTDFLSGKGLPKAEANSEEADAIADDQGKLVLTVDASTTSPVSVTIKAAGYRNEKVSLNLDDKSAHVLQMAPARKHLFISKRTGKYDMYSVYVDGRAETLLLAGTGFERDDFAIIPQTSGKEVAYVSTRNNLRDRDGYLLSTLTLIDSSTGAHNDLVEAQKLQVNGWSGNKVIYTQIAAGASAADPNREHIYSYDYTTNTKKELASSNYFNDVLVAGETVYYAPSDNAQPGPVDFYKINVDGTNRITILNSQVWNIFRSQYDHVSLSAGQLWYDYKLGGVTATKLSGAPASQQNRLYQDDSKGEHSIWIESRDGKGVLLDYDIAAHKDITLQTQSGLSGPAYWLSDSYVIYRVHTDQETADYVLNLKGGQSKKISNVTNTAGLTNWYYY